MKNICKALMIVLFTAGCVGPQTVSINQETVDAQYTKVYKLPIEDVLSVVYESMKDLKWIKLEEHREVLEDLANGQQSWEVKTKKGFFTKSDYKYSWQVVGPKKKVEDLIFIKMRTPLALNSLGAEIYVGLTLRKGETTVRYTGSTSQVSEQEKLELHLKLLSRKVDEKVK